MMRNTPFASPLGPSATDYLAHMRALGRGYDGAERILRHIDAFLARTNSDLSQASFSEWCLTNAHLRSGVRRDRMRTVRNLCLYRRRTEHRPIPAKSSTHSTPHLYRSGDSQFAEGSR